MFQTTISAIESIKSHYEEDTTGARGKVSTGIERMVAGVRKLLTSATALLHVKKDMIVEIAKAYNSVLKGYIAYKPAKKVGESFSTAPAGSESILEAGMKYV